MDVSEVFRENLKSRFAEYKKAGGTQESLAAAAGANQSQISLWLKGTLPSAEKLPGLARALNIPVDALFRPADPDRDALLTLILEADDTKLRRLATVLKGELARAAAKGSGDQTQEG